MNPTNRPSVVPNNLQYSTWFAISQERPHQVATFYATQTTTPITPTSSVSWVQQGAAAATVNVTAGGYRKRMRLPPRTTTTTTSTETPTDNEINNQVSRVRSRPSQRSTTTTTTTITPTTRSQSPPNSTPSTLSTVPFFRKRTRPAILSGTTPTATSTTAKPTTSKPRLVVRRKLFRTSSSTTVMPTSVSSSECTYQKQLSSAQPSSALAPAASALITGIYRSFPPLIFWQCPPHRQLWTASMTRSSTRPLRRRTSLWIIASIRSENRKLTATLGQPFKRFQRRRFRCPRPPATDRPNLRWPIEALIRRPNRPMSLVIRRRQRRQGAPARRPPTFQPTISDWRLKRLPQVSSALSAIASDWTGWVMSLAAFARYMQEWTF